MNRTTSYMILSALLLFAVSASAECWPQLSEAELFRQAQTPFGQKFALITPQIEKQSALNISRIKNAYSNFHAGQKDHIEQAKRLFPVLNENLVVQHTTRIESAISIVKSRSFYSPDELVRRQILNPIRKQSMQTRAYSDGLIGEQDVVFFAIRDKNDSTVEEFGNVRFTMKKEELLDQGYFTPFAFTVGLAPVVAGENWCGSSNSPLARWTSLYRAFVFQGHEAYRDLLVYSAAQRLWEQAKNLKPVRTIIDNELRSLGKTAPESAKTSAKVYSILEDFGQSSDSKDRLSGKFLISLDSYFNERFISTSETQKPPSFVSLVLSSYKGFPIKIGDDSPMATNSYPFWELKVPTKVSLSLVKKIELNKPHREKAAELFRSLRDYAKLSGRQFRENETAGTFEFVECRYWFICQ